MLLASGLAVHRGILDGVPEKRAVGPSGHRNAVDSDAMPLASGSRVGPYEVIAPLGRGGMGEVFKARDTRLNRVVALKSLQAAVASDPDRIARFDREAQLLASLNHPNIGGLLGLQEAEPPPGSGLTAATYLVLEFVDGKPLDAILRESGALPVSDAVPIARQIADAVSAAHERGIIHRDLKPANVMVTADGTVKVLDFGLGKAIGDDSSTAHADSNSPTLTIGATHAGIILGTAAYMSPEQAKGRPADKRSDVWSFGCVLFELLAGRRAFQGEDVSDTLASVLKESPDWSQLPASLPPAIRLLVERCLTKDRSARLADMSTALFLLTEPSVMSSIAAAAPGLPERHTARPQGRFWMVAALLSTAAAVGLGVAYMSGGSSSSDTNAVGTMHVSLAMPADTVLDDAALQPLAISADGQRLAYVATTAGKVKIFVRDLGSSASRELPGTDGAEYPFFSPNGQWVGFVAQNKLKKASIGGGAVETLVSTGATRGAAWAEDGHIYFPVSNVSGLSRVPETGGSPEEVTGLDAASGEISHRDPQVLPGGRAILFTIWKGPGPDEKFVAVKELGGGSHRILIRGGASGRYVSPGYLAYARSDQLFAVRFDLAALEISKQAPVQLDQRIVGESTESAAFAVSATGTLAYLAADPARLDRRIVWEDMSGATEALRLQNRLYEQVKISPDGLSAVVQIVDGSVGLWVLDLQRGALTPLATPGGSSQAPVWTSDSKRVIYRATRNGARNLYWKAADGTGDEERLTNRPGLMHTPYSVSPDGEWVVFSEVSPAGTRGMFRLRLSGNREIVPISANSSEAGGQVSPGGQWQAFEADSPIQIYVRPFPGPGPRTLVSRNGGLEPLWSRDGKSLFYLGERGLYIVDVSAAGATFSAGVPRLLLEKRFLPSPNSVTSYSQGKDGRILHVESTAPDRPVNAIQLVVNWAAELERVVR